MTLVKEGNKLIFKRFKKFAAIKKEGKINMKIIEYDTATSDSEQTLKEFINKKIKNGWQPLGGIAIAISPEDHDVYSQALVKYEKNSNDTL